MDKEPKIGDYTASYYENKYPHLTRGEAIDMAQNANIENAVSIPRTGIGSENPHLHTCTGNCPCGGKYGK